LVGFLCLRSSRSSLLRGKNPDHLIALWFSGFIPLYSNNPHKDLSYLAKISFRIVKIFLFTSFSFSPLLLSLSLSFSLSHSFLFSFPFSLLCSCSSDTVSVSDFGYPLYHG
jgi:hypothetical protein